MVSVSIVEAVEEMGQLLVIEADFNVCFKLTLRL